MDPRYGSGHAQPKSTKFETVNNPVTFPLTLKTNLGAKTNAGESNGIRVTFRFHGILREITFRKLDITSALMTEGPPWQS
jgi:hypothetical protein